jgi:hypothetical protein
MRGQRAIGLVEVNLSYILGATVLVSVLLVWWALTAQRFSTGAGILAARADRKLRATQKRPPSAPTPTARKRRRDFGRR